MPRNYSLDLRSHVRDPRHLVRGVLGFLLAANLIAAWFVFQTPGGTLAELESEVAAERAQLVARRQAIARLKKLVAQTEGARAAGDNFLNAYFLPRKHAYSMLEVDLANAARTAGIRAKERSNSYEPIEGSDTLGMLNVNANFEGTYADLIELVNAIDRSKRLLIIDQLQAQPQQGSNTLAITLKLNAFFRLEGPQEATEVALVEAAEPVPAPVKPPPTPVKAQPAPVVKPVMQQPPPAQVSEPRSGPYPTPPARRTFPTRRVRPNPETEQ